jgi:O-antigen ligase
MEGGRRATGEGWLRLALLFVATLGAAPLGYLATFVLLGLLALAALDLVSVRELPPAGTGLSVGATFAALLLLVIAAIGAPAAQVELLPLLGFSALLFHAAAVWLSGKGAAPGNAARFADRALGGAAIGVATALTYRFGLGFGRAAEGAPFDDPTRLATTATMLGFLALMGLPNGPRKRRYLYLLGPLLGLVVALLAGSRDALVAFPALVVVAAFMLPARRRLASGLAALALMALLAAALLVAPIPGTARTSLGDTLAAAAGGAPVTDAAIAVRLKLYALGWQSFLDAPLYGHGWAHAMDAIHPAIAADEQTWGAVPHLHDDALQFAVAGGGIGLAAYVLILVSPLLAAARMPVDGQAGARRYGLVVLTVGYLAMGLFDTMLASPLSLTLFVTLMALICGWCRDER